MSAHSVARAPLPAEWHRSRRAAVTRPDRMAALAFRVSLACLAATVATNAGAVILEHHSTLPITEALLAVIAAQTAAHQVRRWRDGLADLSHLRAVVVVFGAYVVAALASTLWAADVAAAVAGIMQLVTDMAIVGVLILSIRDERDVRFVLGGLLAGAGAIAGLVAVQTATGSFDQTFGGFAGASVAHIAGETDDLRATGPFEDPNFFAQTMVSMLPFAVALAAAPTAAPCLRAAGAAIAVAMTVTTVQTFSRGALLALVAVLGAMIYRLRSHRFVLRGAVAVAVLAMVALPAEYTARITAIGEVVARGGAAGAEDPSLQGRASEMTAALQMFADRPAGGVGYANYPVLYQRYSPWIGLDPRREPREAHSLYLEIASETGIAGLGVLAIGLALARARIVRGRRQLQAAGSETNLLMLDAVGLALVAFLITSVFLHGAYPRTLWLLLGLALIAPWPILQRPRGLPAGPGAVL